MLLQYFTLYVKNLQRKYHKVTNKFDTFDYSINRL